MTEGESGMTNEATGMTGRDESRPYTKIPPVVRVSSPPMVPLTGVGFLESMGFSSGHRVLQGWPWFGNQSPDRERLVPE